MYLYSTFSTVLLQVFSVSIRSNFYITSSLSPKKCVLEIAACIGITHHIYVEAQDIPLGIPSSRDPGQGVQGSWKDDQNTCEFDYSPWNKLPALSENLKVTEVK